MKLFKERLGCFMLIKRTVEQINFYSESISLDKSNY